MEELIKAREEYLIHYSDLSFLRSKKVNQYILDDINNNIGGLQYKVKIDQEEFIFLYQKLDWESNYFSIDSFKLKCVLFSDKSSLQNLVQAIAEFMQMLDQHEKLYLFIEIPCEDVFVLQALTSYGFKLIESRLTYFNDTLRRYDYPRFPVRDAVEEDIKFLKEVAAVMRNDYDRFHADVSFPDEKADDYLSTYIEQSIKGFTDVVLVPEIEGKPSASFLTANFQKDIWAKINKKVSKMVLSAVSAEFNKGWYLKLISEMSYRLHEEGADCVYMNTQSTNKAVIYTWERLGYRYGGTKHILSYSKK